MFFLVLLLPLVACAACASPIVLYAGPATVNGMLGNRSTTNAMCAAYATAKGLACNSTYMFLAYAGDTVPVNCVPGAPSVCFNSTAPVVANALNGTRIADRWGALFEGGTLVTAMFPTISGIVNRIWTGMTQAGATSTNNCFDWTDAGIETPVCRGNTQSISSGSWICNGVNTVCASLTSTLCVCTPPSAKTFLPTAPTLYPTMQPTTASPFTEVPTTLYPTTASPTTRSPSTRSPTSQSPTGFPTTASPHPKSSASLVAPGLVALWVLLLAHN